MTTSSWDHSNVNKLTFLAVTSTYLLKFILFRILVGLDDNLNIGLICSAYVINIAVAVAAASIVFIDRRRIVSIALLVALDIWMLVNIWYFAANHNLIDWGVVKTATELHGFEDAVFAYMHWSHLVFPLLTIGLIFVLVGTSNAVAHRDGKLWVVGFAISLFLYVAGCVGTRLFDVHDEPHWVFREKEKMFLATHTPLGHLGYVGAHTIFEKKLNREAQMPFSEKEQQLLNTIITDTVSSDIPQSHLVFVLVESLESWALQARDINGVAVCEHLNRYIASHPVLFSPKIITQQQYGRSGDGQLITQTGLLPLSHGVTCMQYGDNVYPNYAHFYPNSVILNPYKGVWNQKVTTYAYGYKHLKEGRVLIHETDSIIFKQAREVLSQAQEPTCVLALTINTHAPFNSVPKTLMFGEVYSATEADYLQCVHYMDKHLGQFLAWADTAATMRDATIVISADHNHFPRKGGKGYCPLIMRSPKIERSIYVPSGYQMDIFPTILSIIGQENYFWKGLGVNLQEKHPHRSISVEQAERLSDKLIRKNYFQRATEILKTECETQTILRGLEI
ncbi:MAG: sulfatase-like hydrolase/transferase [Paludibacteraceae bacterium]|nr:sulfatase-like hydrolase/transferase [Paludibacteraceae bacterium]